MSEVFFLSAWDVVIIQLGVRSVLDVFNVSERRVMYTRTTGLLLVENDRVEMWAE